MHVCIKPYYTQHRWTHQGSCYASTSIKYLGEHTEDNKLVANVSYYKFPAKTLTIDTKGRVRLGFVKLLLWLSYYANP